MKTIGKTIKEIREMKGIKTTEMRDISRSTLHTIENGNSVPSLENLHIILKNLAISEKEFFFRLNNFQLSEQEALIQEFRQINQSSETDKIIHLQEKYLRYLQKKPNDKTIQSFLLLLKTYQEIQRKNTFLIKSRESNLLYDELLLRASKGNWTFLETYLASRIFYCFPPEKAKTLIHHIQDSLLRYSELNNEKRFHCAFLLNCGHYFFELKLYEEAKEMLSNAQNYSKIYQEASAFLGSSFVLLQIDYIQQPENRTNIDTKIQTLTNTAKLLEYNGLALNMESDFNQLKNETIPN
ncbi:TPA_asm: hypothetical protein GIH59_12610 [Listeria monocytogenes]|nr:hypothetical protein [Listeria monocytogenes]